MKANRQSLFFLPIILLIAAFYLYPTNERSFIQIAVHEKHRGVCWVGGPSMVDDTDLQQLAEKMSTGFLKRLLAGKVGTTTQRFGTTTV